MKIPPKKIAEEKWFVADDYPAEAVSKREHGTTFVMYLVNVSGKTEDCRTVSSSGSKTLDDAACRVITMRARYASAMDVDNKPIALHQIRRTVWRLPD